MEPHDQTDTETNSQVLFPFRRTLLPAEFVRRINRFVAEVKIDGETVPVHVPNTGRMSELLVEGRTVGLMPADSQNRKTAYDLTLVRFGSTWVCVDSGEANRTMERWFRSLSRGDATPSTWGELERVFSGITGVRREVGLGPHRFDFQLERGESAVWVEVKSVNLVVDGQALFPDAPTKRGTSHLELLAREAQSGSEASVLFVVQRNDARRFAPNRDMDPEFAEALRQAARAGVRVHAVSLTMSPDGAHPASVLPVEL